MFDITPDDIKDLNDSDLRELVGRLCEAELERLGRSPAMVTWGGKQTAADGGLDVRVALPPGESIEGFIQRPSTGFQVKKPDMPRAAILAEMRPEGEIRPVIQGLANEAGAYIIVTSEGSTSDSALRSRREALREALKGVTNAAQLQTDFHDRTRVATWVQRHSMVEKTRRGDRTRLMREQRQAWEEELPILKEAFTALTGWPTTTRPGTRLAIHAGGGGAGKGPAVGAENGRLCCPAEIFSAAAPETHLRSGKHAQTDERQTRGTSR